MQKITAYLVLVTLMLFNSIPLMAQVPLDVEVGCNYNGDGWNDRIYGFSSDAEAEDAVERILEFTGLPTKNFDIRAANVANAAAVIYGGERYILYNQEFMMRVKRVTKTDWAATSIMAHEIGHHLSGHTLDNSGSRPDLELEADRFSGFVLYRMGATLEEAQAALQSLKNGNASATHPPKSARLAAVTNGWSAAKEQASGPLESEPEQKTRHYPDFEMKFSGTVGESLEVRMTLRNRSGRLSGHYYYVKVGKDINLKGKIGKKGEIELNGYHEGEHVDVFEGRMRDNRIEGRWTSPDQSRSLPFQLEN